MELSYLLILIPNCSPKFVRNKFDFMPFLENNSKFLLEDFFLNKNRTTKLLLENLTSKGPVSLIVECTSHTVWRSLQYFLTSNSNEKVKTIVCVIFCKFYCHVFFSFLDRFNICFVTTDRNSKFWGEKIIKS